MLKKTSKIAAVCALTLIAIYLVLGFVVLPLAVTQIAPGIISDKIAGKCEIGRVGLNPITFSLSIDDLDLHSDGGSELFHLERVIINVDPLAYVFSKQIRLREFRVRGLSVFVEVDKHGRVNLLDAIALNPSPEQTEISPKEHENEQDVIGQADSKPLMVPDFWIGLLDVSDVSIAYYDSSGNVPFSKKIQELSLKLEDVRSDPEKTNRLVFQVSTDSAEKIRIESEFRFDPLTISGVFEMIAIDLPSYSPLLQNASGAAIESGKLNLHLGFECSPLSQPARGSIKDSWVSLSQLSTRISAENPAKFTLENLRIDPVSATFDLEPQGSPHGKLALNMDLSKFDAAWMDSNTSFASFSDFKIRELELNLEPIELNIGAVDFIEPHVLVERDSQGGLLLSNLTGAKKSQEIPSEDAEEPAPDTGVQVVDDSQGPEILIKQFNLQEGLIKLNDESVRPKADVVIAPINIGVNNLSLDPEQETKASLELLIENQGEILMNAGFFLADPSKSTQMNCEIISVPLKPFSAFATQAIGYEITEGAFSGTLNASIQNHELVADNDVQFSTIRFGNVDPNFSGTVPPVKIAVAALENSQGIIGLKVPINGSLEDPSFSVLGVVGDIFRKILTNAATAPLRLATGAVGGLLNQGLSAIGVDAGKDPSVLEFDLGSSELSPEIETSLETISKLMLNRPKMDLVVHGSVDAEKDLAAYKEALIDLEIAGVPGESRTQKIRALYHSIFERAAVQPDVAESATVDSSNEASKATNKQVKPSGEKYYLTGQKTRAQGAYYLSGKTRVPFMRPLVKTQAKRPPSEQEASSMVNEVELRGNSNELSILEMKSAILEERFGKFIDISMLARVRQTRVFEWLRDAYQIPVDRLRLSERAKRTGAHVYFELTTKSDTTNKDEKSPNS